MKNDLDIIHLPRAETPKTGLEKLAAIGQDPAIHWLSTLSRIASETSNHLDKLSKLVAEGKAVDEAANFCRWLQFSRVLSLPNDAFKDVRSKSEVLLSSVQRIYASGITTPKYGQSDIDMIAEKLDALLRNTPKPVMVEVQPVTEKATP